MEFCTRIGNQLMLQKIYQKGFSKNIVSSPLSINVVLNMVVAGSTGSTLKRMLGFLGSKNVDEIHSKSRKMMAMTANSSDGPILNIVNGAWVDQRFPLVPKYKEEVLKGIFKCEANNVDFRTKDLGRYFEADVELSWVRKRRRNQFKIEEDDGGSTGHTLKHMLGFIGSKNNDEINSKSRKMMAVAAGGGVRSSENVGNGQILTMVNGAWADRRFPLVSKYKEEVLKGIFKCKVTNVDFRTKPVAHFPQTAAQPLANTNIGSTTEMSNPDTTAPPLVTHRKDENQTPKLPWKLPCIIVASCTSSTNRGSTTRKYQYRQHHRNVKPGHHRATIGHPQERRKPNSKAAAEAHRAIK
ncbi:hypothetical protein RHMOL_Rhmol06G0056200 [Rhododendron molle]|uniref:Uncharacterized protein n=1 Tax=Rhododendron molle TaxID=49168 RepID=A0ACC0NAK0_RHOML|nr:hypothetical protein RHMOL_Rhmol06G0056200 [Rhododendron molle]